MKSSVIFGALALAAFGVAAQETGTVVSTTPVVSQENRTVGYNVTYDYNGRRYQAQLPVDPGPTIYVRVTQAGEVRPMMRMYRGNATGTGPVQAPPMQYTQRQQPMQMQQHQPMQQQQQMQQQEPMQQQQMHPPMQHMQPMPPRDVARNYGEAVPPEQERQGTNTSATESGNAALFGYGYPYGYGYPVYPAYGYGYPAYPAYPAYGYGYGYAYPAFYGAAVLPVYRPYYRPWAGYYRPWGGYYRPWGYGPRVSVGVGVGYHGRWR
ncbi:hypothetical protein WG902_10835 [Ramlibacter sp. PS3R-8]|uniref:hypothetical protein n=1 Tax=Ramlibacter sp. PS3R-8 TaxID=3133437 RepID=UPI003098EA1B